MPPTVLSVVMPDGLATVVFGGDDGFDLGLGQFLGDGVDIVALFDRPGLDLVRDRAEKQALKRWISRACPKPGGRPLASHRA